MKLPVVAVAATSAFSAACLSIPSYQGPPQGPVLVGYSEDSRGGATIETSSFKLHFAGGSFHFPDQLLLDDVDVMGHAASPCWGQSGTGIAVVPMPRISGDLVDGGLPAMTSELQAVLRGPAVVQLKIDWTTRWTFPAGPMCSKNVSHIPGGTSTFTVFPDGQIVRHDHLTDMNPGMEQITANNCMCPDVPLVDGQFILSSYWTFDRARFPDQRGLGSNGPTSPDELGLAPGRIITNYSTICLDSSDGKHQVASAWVVPPETPAGLSPLASAFGYDTLVSLDVQKPGTGNLEFPWDVHGALFVEQSGCRAAISRAIAYTSPANLAITTGSATTSVAPSPLDGLYGGDPGDGNPGFLVSDGPTTLSGPLPRPFAVRLRFPGAVPGVPIAIRRGATGAWYVPQRGVDDRDWILWFQDPLQAGETITVQPN